LDLLKRSQMGVIMTTFRNALGFATFAIGVLASPEGAQDKSLYPRLGGYDAIAAVSDEFIGRLANDDMEKRFFVGFSTDSKKRIRQHLVDQLCNAAGGPCVYTGRTMKTWHAGAGITKADWDHSVKVLVEVLDKFKVPEKEQKDLFALLGPMEKDIVEK
jgi:hemoglobin